MGGIWHQAFCECEDLQFNVGSPSVLGGGAWSGVDGEHFSFEGTYRADPTDSCDGPEDIPRQAGSLGGWFCITKCMRASGSVSAIFDAGEGRSEAHLYIVRGIEQPLDIHLWSTGVGAHCDTQADSDTDWVDLPPGQYGFLFHFDTAEDGPGGAWVADGSNVGAAFTLELTDACGGS